VGVVRAPSGPPLAVLGDSLRCPWHGIDTSGGAGGLLAHRESPAGADVELPDGAERRY
jgi:hypothetical protein